MDPLHATIEEFAADGYTHIECFCPRCRVIRLRPMSWLPRISMGLTLAQLSTKAEMGRVFLRAAIRQAVASSRHAREAARAKRLACSLFGRLPLSVSCAPIGNAKLNRFPARLCDSEAFRR